MSSFRFCKNPAKTKFMWFGTRLQLAKINLDDLANKFPSHWRFYIGAMRAKPPNHEKEGFSPPN